ncbi:MAG: PP2C family protein-serine/threonine phosphatase [Terracidiphilus sp.]
MAVNDKPWILRPSTPWKYFRAAPLSRMWVLMAAIFFNFSVIGFYVDLTGSKGGIPYAVVATIAFACGLDAVLWIVVLTRMSRLSFFVLIVLQFFAAKIINAAANWVVHTFHPPPVASATGIQFDATGILCVVLVSYVCFIKFINQRGAEAFRLQNELTLAHGIQKTLVPPVALRSPQFEVYGISCPSDKVGGDLVDALHLSNGDTVAYLADIAGHGLQAGILMGMLKTAARTALLDAGDRPPDRTLPVLLDRLNTILPEVKELQMYATFTGFRLGVDGSVFYALAASPPFLHWHAAQQRASHTDEPQLPLGLLPVPAFEGAATLVASGDLLVVATDGILEVADKRDEDFGVERLKDVVAANANDGLPQLAEKILTAARAFGRQFDDQTILIVRCL